MDRANYLSMLLTAIEEARRGLAEGGIPIGAAVFDRDGRLVGSGHNRRVQEGDPSAHGETDAFRKAGRRRSYREMTMVTTPGPGWYGSGVVRQVWFGGVVGGERETVRRWIGWLRENGVEVVDLDSAECKAL